MPMKNPAHCPRCRGKAEREALEARNDKSKENEQQRSMVESRKEDEAQRSSRKPRHNKMRPDDILPTTAYLDEDQELAKIPELPEPADC